MICKNCGAEISDGLLFCPKCSSRIQGDIKDSAQNTSSQNNLESNNNFVPSGGSIENKGIPSYSNNSFNNNQYGNNPYYNNSYNSYTAPDYTYDKKSSRKGPGIAVTIISIVATILVVFKIGQYYFKSKYPNYVPKLFSGTVELNTINPQFDIQGDWTGTDSEDVTANIEITSTDLSMDFPDEKLNFDNLAYKVTEHDKKTIDIALTGKQVSSKLGGIHFAFLNKDKIVMTIIAADGTQGAVELHRIKRLK